MITDFTLKVDDLSEEDRDGIDLYFGWDDHIFIVNFSEESSPLHSLYCKCGLVFADRAKHNLIQDLTSVVALTSVWRKNSYADLSLQEFLKKTLNETT